MTYDNYDLVLVSVSRLLIGKAPGAKGLEFSLKSILEHNILYVLF